jgi:hypothetical protein
MVRTVGLGLPQQHPLPSASATSSTSTEQHLLQRPEARERTPPSGTPLSALQQMLSEALEEFDYPDSSSASLPQHAIPPSSSSSASTPEPRFLLNDSEHIDPFVSDAIDRVISVVSPNDFSIDLSYETINFITQNRPHLRRLFRSMQPEGAACDATIVRGVAAARRDRLLGDARPSPASHASPKRLTARRLDSRHHRRIICVLPSWRHACGGATVACRRTTTCSSRHRSC